MRPGVYRSVLVGHHVPRETGNNAFEKFGGTNKEYYSIFLNGLFTVYDHNVRVSIRAILELELTQLYLFPTEAQFGGHLDVDYHLYKSGNM